MKQTLLTALLLASAMTASSATYEYLVFETSDGIQKTMTANGLKLVYKDGTLTASNTTDSQTFTLSNLNRMFFSKQDDATAITITTADDINDVGTEIYDLSGRRLPQGTTLPKGLYIFKKGNTTTKKYVK